MFYLGTELNGKNSTRLSTAEITIASNVSRIGVNETTIADHETRLGTAEDTLETLVDTAGIEINKYDTLDDFPAEGSDLSLYLARDTDKLYHWETDQYVEVSNDVNIDTKTDGGIVFYDAALDKIDTSSKLKVEEFSFDNGEKIQFTSGSTDTITIGFDNGEGSDRDGLFVNGINVASLYHEGGRPKVIIGTDELENDVRIIGTNIDINTSTFALEFDETNFVRVLKDTIGFSIENEIFLADGGFWLNHNKADGHAALNIDMRDDGTGKLTRWTRNSVEKAYIDKDGGMSLSGDLNIAGNIIQQGSAYETHAEQVYTTNDTIILRDGAVSGLAVGAYAGLRGQRLPMELTMLFLQFDGNGIARVGDDGDTSDCHKRR